METSTKFCLRWQKILKSFRCDKGSEYTSQPFGEICMNVGIRQKLRQNGVAEHFWRTICDMTR